jgi:hypothetical protein
VHGLTRSEPIGQAALPPRSRRRENRGATQISYWAATGPFAVRIDCQMATLNPMTEIISAPRLTQSPTVILIGS